jgi:hypothetical protein
MPVVLVIIIVAAWAVILGPSLLKRRANSGGVQSITHFHHQLRVLEQRAPEPLVAPAYRLRSVDGTGSPTGIHYPDDGRPPVLTVVGAKELPRPALAFLGEPEVVEPVASRTVPDTPSPAAPSPADSYGDPRRSDDPHAGPVPIPTAYDHRRPAAYAPPVDPSPAPRAMESVTRAQARRRRRDTLAVLFGLFFVMLLVGLMTGATGAWAVAGLDGVALAAYVVLLVHLRRMAQERELKLRYLDPGAERGGRVSGPPSYVSGRYAHPSSQQAVAR